MRRDDYDDPRPTPVTVVAAVAAGTVAVPFIAIYAVLFIVHGSVHPVVPPDITDSTNGELLAGIIAAVVLVLCILALFWAANGRRRWPFVAVQLCLLAGTIWFLVDGTKGGELATVVVLVASAAALVLILVPLSARHYAPGPRTAAAPAAPPLAPPAAAAPYAVAPPPPPPPVGPPVRDTSSRS